MNDKCNGCKYCRPLNGSSKSEKACHYMYDTGESKGCRAENCDKYEADTNYAEKRRADFRDGKFIEKPAIAK